MLVTLALIAATVSLPEGWAASAWPTPVATWPVLTLPVVIGIALPLFIVTMASQNIPGIAVLNVNGYAAAAATAAPALQALAGVPVWIGVALVVAVAVVVAAFLLRQERAV